MRKKIKMYILLIVIILVLLPFAIFYMNRWSYKNTQESFKKRYTENAKNQLPNFTSQELAYKHQFADTDENTAMPFLDVKLILPYGDGVPCIFETGGQNQANAILKYENGVFTNVAKALNLEGILNEAAYSIAYEDMDNDGIKEIITGYASGVYLQKFDASKSRYGDMRKIAEVPDAALPHDFAIADTRNTGLKDIYVCTFVDKAHFKSAKYHDATDKRQNLYLVNNGDGSFTEKSKSAGLELIQNSYLAQFVDLDNNGNPDLVLALNTDVGKIYKNNGDGTFSEKRLPINYGFWMGLAIAKLDNKSDKYHILLSNTGKSFPEFLLKGDLKKDEVFSGSYALLEQIKDFEFKDVTKENNLYSDVFGWGVTFADLNNNGRKDAIITENYIKFPLNIHKTFAAEGKVLFQGEDGSFAPFQKEVNLLNPNFGYRVLTYDFTQNGYLDVVIGNINGPLMLFENKGIQ